jgi:elongation factor P--(R)-beta-lysine ligase
VSDSTDWRPSANPARLRARAKLLGQAREFFAQRGVLEVNTPILVNAPVSDVHLHSACVQLSAEGQTASARLYLHTSPEYAMKRLLAAGSGDIYQICPVVRAFESGRLHNPEFVLIEWYRLGMGAPGLMDEVEALVRTLLGEAAGQLGSERLSYCEAFRRVLDLDPLSASEAQLANAARALNLGEGTQLTRDAWLELLMGAIVGPTLGQRALTFVHSYPASQAALARLSPADPRTAERFELYCQGIELANGFHELADEGEQAERFRRDNAERKRLGLPVAAVDGRLLAALGAGLPECAGVALGFERVLMLATGAQHIDEVLAFPTARA